MVLLDTHVLLWTITNDDRLGARARRLIDDRDNDVYYSVFCLWEVQIKHQNQSEQSQTESNRDDQLNICLFI